MEDIVTEVIDEVENLAGELFTPKPGGMIDNFRKEKARAEAAAHEAENLAEKVEEFGAYAVKVIILSPEKFNSNSVNVAAGGIAMILPRNLRRKRATIISTAAVTIAGSQSQALNQIGFPLAANTPLLVEARGQLWAYATGAAVVSFLSESYADA